MSLVSPQVKQQQQSPPPHCKCYPHWLKSIYDRTNERCCHHCNAPLEGLGIQTLVYRCSGSYRDRFHMCGLLFCSEEGTSCCSDFNMNFPYAKLVDIFPFQPATTQRLLGSDEKKAKALKFKHRRTSERCAYCNTPEERGNFKLKSCGGCKYVRYCNSTCQNADWDNHKLLCRAKRGDKKALRQLKCLSEAKGTATNRIPECVASLNKECLKGLNYRPFKDGKCSYVKCNNVVPPPYNFCMVVLQCGTPGHPAHMISTQYCSSGCRKRGTA